MAGNFRRDGFASIDNQGSRLNYLSSLLPTNSISNDLKSYNNGLPPVEDKKYLGVVLKQSTDKYEILQKERNKRANEENFWPRSYDYIIFRDLVNSMLNSQVTPIKIL